MLGRKKAIPSTKKIAHTLTSRSNNAAIFYATRRTGLEIKGENMLSKKLALTLLVTLLGVSISRLAALSSEYEDCPLGSSSCNAAIKTELPKPLGVQSSATVGDKC